MIAALVGGAHLPLAMLVLLAGAGVTAGSRDLMKRLMGAFAMLFAGVAYFLVLAPEAGGAGLAAVVLALAGGALGAALTVRIREGFGGLDAVVVRKGLDEDAEAAEREVA